MFKGFVEIDHTLSKNLINKHFYKVSCVSLMSCTSYQDSLEEEIDKILQFAKSQENSVIVFDEIHQLTMANKNNIGSNSTSVLDFFKEDLARSRISIIGMTTNKEFAPHLSDEVLKRRFNRIELKQPLDKKEMENICRDYFDMNSDTLSLVDKRL